MLSFFPRNVLDEIWDLIESVSDGFPTYSQYFLSVFTCMVSTAFCYTDYAYAYYHEMVYVIYYDDRLANVQLHVLIINVYSILETFNAC